jgi:AcrR family transcriptional regulator
MGVRELRLLLAGRGRVSLAEVARRAGVRPTTLVSWYGGRRALKDGAVIERLKLAAETL